MEPSGTMLKTFIIHCKSEKVAKINVELQFNRKRNRYLWRFVEQNIILCGFFCSFQSECICRFCDFKLKLGI